MSQTIHHSMRLVQWALLVGLAVSSALGTWGCAPKSTPLSVPMVTVGPSPTPTVTVEPSPTPTMVEPSPTPTVTVEPVQDRCTVVLQSGSVNYDGGSVPPGGVVCLEEGDYAKIVFRNLRGTAEQPITIRNHGGLVRMTGANQVRFRQCVHTRFTGSGVAGIKYGIYIRGQTLRVDFYSHHFELDHIEMDGERIRIKDGSHPTFEMTDIHVHHNYIHDSDWTGIYIGVANYDLHPGDYEMRRVNVHHNTIRNMGGQGIKVAGVVEDCKVHHNTVENVITKEVHLQDAAIKIGAGSGVKVYNNIINGSGKQGIQGNDSFFSSEIYNNLIIDAGGKADGNEGDVFITWYDGYKVYNNTIVGAERYGLNFASGGNNNYAYNNIILSTIGASINSPGMPGANIHHNLTKEDGYTPANVGFVDLANGDYHLAENSPAVDAGARPSFPFAFDVDDRSRPVDGYYDIGAYEFRGTPSSVITPTP